MQISRTWIAGSLVLALAAACSTAPSGGDAAADAAASGGLGSTTGGNSGFDLGSDGPTDGPTDLSVDGSASGGGSLGGAGAVCEEASSAAEPTPVFLGFAFDVSGSMGKLDSPNWWHDPAAKWAPVALAISAFFENPASAGLQASMALFPADDDGCDSSSYLTPNVPMTGLPAATFAAELAAYEAEVGSPLAGGDWRGGTPTHAAIRGVADYLESIRASSPSAEFALVLVTDGLPQGCDEDLADIIDLVGELSAAGIDTYVIGIENPTVPPSDLPEGWDDWGECDAGDGGGDTPCTPPATLQALDDIAAAGATGSAFLIDTGDPAATEVAFQVAIEAIRSDAISCSLPIPPHPVPGMTFDGDKIDVSTTSAGTSATLPYDETCSLPVGWHFDDPSSPTHIELCDSTCASVRAASDSAIDVDFLCEPRIDVVK